MEIRKDPSIFFAITTGCVAFMVVMMLGFIFFTALPVFETSGIQIFTGTEWNYNTHQYGMLAMIAATLLLTGLTILIATPLGVFTAIYLSEWAPKSITRIMRPMIELLVGIPSVVYGIFGFLVLEPVFSKEVNPFIDQTLGFIPLFKNSTPNVGSGYLLAALILTIMILPTIVALSQEAIRAVPENYREAAYALGSTKWETIHRIVIPAASSGIITSVVLGVMRAMGETMAVVMVIGTVMHLPRSLLDTGMPMTTRILIDSSYYMALPEPRAALFAIAFVLFCIEILFVASIRLIGKRFGDGYK